MDLSFVYSFSLGFLSFIIIVFILMIFEGNLIEKVFGNRPKPSCIHINTSRVYKLTQFYKLTQLGGWPTFTVDDLIVNPDIFVTYKKCKICGHVELVMDEMHKPHVNKELMIKRLEDFNSIESKLIDIVA